MKVKVITPELRSGTLSYSPVRVHRLSATPRGIELHHHAAGEVSWSAIHMLAVVASTNGGSGAPDFLLFVAGSRRPFLVASDVIDYFEFEVEAPSVDERLRSFLRHLLTQNRAIGIDQGTFDFLSGRAAQKLDRDVTALCTAIGGILSRIGKA